MMSENRVNSPRSLYIHIPFCKRKCPYCDFYSVTGFSLVYDYIDAVCRNLAAYDGLVFDTVYFGGGTPSLLPAAFFAQMLEHLEFAENAEVTVEVNPDSTTPEFLHNLREAGVNRLSVGVQSLFDDDLKTLGRLHNTDKAIQTLKAAKSAGFNNISADLMIALPGQTEARIAEAIAQLADLSVNHISAYLLKIENGTPFFSNTPADLPDDERTADLYLFTVSELEKHGFAQYEISNFAKPGFKSRHNTAYWLCREYIGIGPGAHSYFGGKRFAAERDLDAFIRSENQPTYITDENPGGEAERIMLALRLTDTGIHYTSACDKFIKAGLMKRLGENAALTPEGCLVSNLIIGELAQL
jgi:oxygen-independent coproporphyrinogen-3 oxidase